MGKDGAGGKPGVLRPQATTTRVRILDFGLARRSTDPSLTSTGFVVGTPHYMSPEQASGLPRRWPVRSLLVGMRPLHDVDRRTAVSRQHGHGGHDVPRNSNARRRLTKRTRPFRDRFPISLPGCLEKEPDARTQNAREVVAVLDEVLADLSGTTTLPPPRTVTTTITQGLGETPLMSKADRVPSSSAPIQPPRSRWRLPGAVWAGLALLLGLVAFLGYREFRHSFTTEPEPIAVGILHSQTGTMAVSEAPVVDATLLAIEEINAAGGVLGRRLKPVIVDGESNPDVFAAAAERLLDDEKAAVIFGCWTSASRKAVRDVLQRRPEGLLFYPVQYEGLERSPRIVYLGAAPNQQLLPAVEFLTRSVEPRADSARSDSTSSARTTCSRAPRTRSSRIRFGSKQGRQRSSARRSFRFGSADVARVVDGIKRTEADAIVNTINGSTNVALLPRASQGDRHRGRSPDALGQHHRERGQRVEPDRARGRLPRRELLPVDRSAGEPRVPAQAPRALSRTASARMRPRRPTAGVHLWAKAVAKAGTTDPTAVARSLSRTGVRRPTCPDQDRPGESPRLAAGADRPNPRGRTGRSRSRRG